MCCPAPEPFNDAFADSADLSHNVWAMGVEDSPQQRRILLLIFKRLGIPDERIIIIGGDDEEIKNMVSYARDFFQSIPKDASLLMVVDENLDLGWPSEGTISGSSSVKVLRESLGASEEKRLLAVRCFSTGSLPCTSHEKRGVARCVSSGTAFVPRWLLYLLEIPSPRLKSFRTHPTRPARTLRQRFAK
eukprot:scaffold81689_cov34-Tisochrysis_lutea.AAC.4